MWLVGDKMSFKKYVRTSEGQNSDKMSLNKAGDLVAWQCFYNFTNCAVYSYILLLRVLVRFVNMLKYQDLFVFTVLFVPCT